MHMRRINYGNQLLAAIKPRVNKLGNILPFYSEHRCFVKSETAKQKRMLSYRKSDIGGGTSQSIKGFKKEDGVKNIRQVNGSVSFEVTKGEQSGSTFSVEAEEYEIIKKDGRFYESLSGTFLTPNKHEILSPRPFLIVSSSGYTRVMNKTLHMSDFLLIFATILFVALFAMYLNMSS